MNKKVEEGRRLRLSYNLTKEDKLAFYQYLNGKINSRELGSLVGMSHQGAIGAAVQISRDWIATGNLNFRSEFISEIGTRP